MQIPICGMIQLINFGKMENNDEKIIKKVEVDPIENNESEDFLINIEENDSN